MLDRDYDFDSTIIFYKKRFLHLLVVTIIWSLLYSLYISFNYNFDKTIIEDLLLVHKVYYDRIFDHMWFLYSILNIYIIIPFVSKSLKIFDKKVILIPFSLLFIYNIIVPTINAFYRCYSNLKLESQITTNLLGGYVGLYVIIGYYLKKNVFKKFKTTNLLLISLLSICAAVFMQLFAYSKHFDYNVFYDNLFILMSSISLFEAFSRIKFKNNYLIIALSKLAFPIYLIHKIVQDIVGKHIVQLPINMPLQVMSLFVVIFIVSLIISLIIKAIPKIGNYILYEK